MARTKADMTDVLAQAFATFAILAENALVPSQKRMATERAGNCLWALGITEFKGFVAIKPDTIGDTIEGVPIRLIQSS
ncbi:hypothetical protein [Salipiger thiooxidans]|uniref:hypothetical protein n=1 Tax=Salipiger thiooxidans TaxID=282683 RepID=UPI001CD6CD08|nr:hypothetical protein [Salipiger thiooxidans]MCA0850374.1 hypothetical protein [Salipiger thiooxidans]